MPLSANNIKNVWHFACAVYDAEDVQAACLSLQNQYDADIPLLLFCFWLGKHHQCLSHEQRRRVLDCASLWREYSIKPLRRLRQNMKNITSLPMDIEASAAMQDNVLSRWQTTREKVKAIELEAEQSLLYCLADCVSDATDSAMVESTPEEVMLHCMLTNTALCLPQVFSNPDNLAIILSAVDVKISYDDALKKINQYPIS